MAEILDLDAFEPKDRKEPFVFRFGGEEFATRGPHEFDIRDLAGANDPAYSLALMLGEDGWQRLDALDKVFDIERFNELAARWFSHHGIDPGKLNGSPGHSKNMRIR